MTFWDIGGRVFRVKGDRERLLPLHDDFSLIHLNQSIQMITLVILNIILKNSGNLLNLLRISHF